MARLLGLDDSAIGRAVAADSLELPAPYLGEVGLPEPEIPPMAEELLRQTEEEQILREAMTGLAPRCRKLVEMLFFESPARPYSEVANELKLAVGSIGLTRQKCIETLRKRLDELGFS